MCGHGTNLTSALKALIHSNKQMVPTIKAKKLGIEVETGEGFGTGIPNCFNQLAVSTISLKDPSMADLKSLHYYKDNASRVDGFLKKVELPSYTIPTIVLGDGVAVPQSYDASMGWETFKKRVNIRMMAVNEKDKELVLAMLTHLGHDDVGICTFDDLDNLKVYRSYTSWERSLPHNSGRQV
jgi:hypothetical protein